LSTTASVGFSSSIYGQLVDMVLEYVPDLTWPLSIRTFARMRWDPTLQSALKAYTLPIRRASWALDPDPGCRPEVVAVRRRPDGPATARRRRQAWPGSPPRRVSWADHLRLSLLDLTFGHMPFERTYDVRSDGGQARLDVSLQERMPQSLAAINVANRRVAEVDPQNRGVGQQGDPEITAQNLLWYAHDREGASWTGQSLLRPAYAAWLLKDETWRVHATSRPPVRDGRPAVSGGPARGDPGAGRGGAARSPPRSAPATSPASAARRVPPRAAGHHRLGPGRARVHLLPRPADVTDGPDRAPRPGRHPERLPGARRLVPRPVPLRLQAIADETPRPPPADRDPLVDVNYGEDEPAPRIVSATSASTRSPRTRSLRSSPPARCSPTRPWTRSSAASGRSRAGDPAADYAGAVEVIPSDRRSASAASRTRCQPAAVAAAVTLRRQPTAIEAAAKTDFVAVQQQWQTAVDRSSRRWQTDVTPPARRPDQPDRSRPSVPTT
jgi:hypothetical protein